MDFQLATLVLSGAVAVTYIWYARCRASSIGDVPGPKNPSWMYGISRSSRSQRRYLMFWNRSSMLVEERRGGCSREEHLGRIRNYSSLEWDTWGSYLSWDRAQFEPNADAVIQEQRLWVADPKAIHHILQGSSHLYEKTPVIKELLAMVTDRGIATVEGELSLTCHIMYSKTSDSGSRRRT